MATRASNATSFAVVGRSDRGPFASQFMSSKSKSSLRMDVNVAHGKARCASRSVTRSSEEGPSLTVLWVGEDEVGPGVGVAWLSDCGGASSGGGE